jgi:DivIVA domain-containing protein
VTTVLFYLVIAAVIGLVVFFLAVLVFGRGEQMAPLDPRTSPAELPDHDIDSEDVRKIRFALALRGYRMSDVDWTLERLGQQIDELRLENAHLRNRVSLIDGPAPDDRDAHEVLEDGPRADGARADGAGALGVRGTEPLEGDTAAYDTAEDDTDRWGPLERSWPVDHSDSSDLPGASEPTTLPQAQMRDRMSARETAPAVDR